VEGLKRNTSQLARIKEKEKTCDKCMETEVKSKTDRIH